MFHHLPHTARRDQEARVIQDPRHTQAGFDTEAAHLRIRALRRLARRDPVLAAMLADDLRWMPAVLLCAALLVLACAALSA